MPTFFYKFHYHSRNPQRYRIVPVPSIYSPLSMVTIWERSENSGGSWAPSTRAEVLRKEQEVRVGILQALNGHPYQQRCEVFIWWSHCALSFAPIVNVLLLHWWACQFPSNLISQLWSLLSTIRQAQKEAFSCSSVLEIFLQTEKGSRE